MCVHQHPINSSGRVSIFVHLPTTELSIYSTTEFSLCLLKGVGEGCVLGGVTNHIKAFKLHLLKDQGNFLLKALKFKHLKYAGENTVLDYTGSCNSMLAVYTDKLLYNLHSMTT